ncbi:ROK family protein [Kribbella antibiotica]|uniref:ROK family protein n=1 Tax=Kribbella antibiotica TaxID=190195 RepID=A0A4R4ZL86_9ACTN|nr:ROK family protein [Kribbella antibiotica]TDD58846.1 ROK family protein [Kribbella antibiotica]
MDIVCGVDLGGTNTRIAIVDPAGRVVARERDTTPRGTGVQIARQLAERIAKLAGTRPIRTVIGVPGAVHPRTGVIRTAPNAPRLEGTAFSDALPGSCFVNDANAALYGEAKAGVVQDSTDAVMVTVGTGVGTAALLQRQLLTGRSGAVGEFGALPYRHGTFEDACSGSAMTRAAQAAGFDDPRAIFTEPVLRSARSDAFEALSQLLATLTTAYDPDIIVLGGGVASSLAQWLEPLRETLLPITPEPPLIALGALGDDAGAIGAAHLALDQPSAGLLSWDPRHLPRHP